MNRLQRLLPIVALVAAGCTTSDGGDAAAVASRAGGAGTGWPGGPVPSPAQLVGLDASRLEQLLGPADFTRSDGPAEIRQYRDADCVLDVFLYADPASGGYQVAHVDGRDRGLGGDAGQACVAALLRARSQRVAG